MEDYDFEATANFNYYQKEEVDNKYVCIKTPPECPTKGGPEFYLWRFNNFMERHVDCDHQPPSYYYGPLETQEQINSFVKEVEDKNYKVRLPAAVLFRVPTYILPYVAALDLSDLREIWLNLEKDLAKKQKEVPVTHRGTIPNISKSYGYKYCIAFNERLYPYLSKLGQKWIKEALMNLQKYMDQGLCSQTWVAVKNVKFNEKYMLYDKDKREEFYTNLELRSEAFKEFAFATHPDAYLDAELEKLPYSDLAKIMITPDFAEWKHWATWDQARLVAPDVFEQKAEDVYEAVKDGAQKIYKKVTGIFD